MPNISFAEGTRTVSENNYNWNNDNTIFYFKLSPVLNVIFLLLGDSPASEFYVPSFGTLCSIFVVGVSRKNNWNEFFLLTQPTKMEQTECSETSANKIQKQRNH